jgi:HEAT repeat protein
MLDHDPKTIASALRTSDENACYQASQRFRKLGPTRKQAVPILIDALGDERYFVRHEAVALLLFLGPDATSAIPRLRDIAHEDQENGALRSLAIDALGTIGVEAIPTLCQLLNSPDPTIRMRTADAFQRLKEHAGPGIPALIERFNDPDPQVRQTSSDTLCEIGPVVMPHLRQALRQEDPLTQIHAAFVLLRINPADQEAFGKAALGMKHSKGDVRSRAAQTLSLKGVDATPALSLLTEGLKDTDPDVRLWSINTLWKLGSQGSAAVPALIEILNEDEQDLRQAAAQALAHIGPEARAAIPALIKALDDDDAFLRLCSTGALGCMARDVKEVIRALEKATNDTDSNVREAAEVALDRIRRR